MSHEHPSSTATMPPGHGPDPKGAGLGVTALVLGIVALLLCLVPIANYVAVVLGLVAVVLGVLGRRGLRAGKGLAVAGIVTGVLAVVGGLLSAILYAAVFNAVDEAVTQTAQDVEDAAADQGVAADDAKDMPTAETLPIGEPAQVGEYRVVVTGVDLDANEEIAAANEFNEAPTNQYVTVGLDVTYTGAEEGDPSIDLTTVFTGTDARQYDASSCEAVTAAESLEVPTLNTGGQASYQVCMDVPASAIDGGAVSVEETLSFDDSKVFWAID